MQARNSISWPFLSVAVLALLGGCATPASDTPRVQADAAAAVIPAAWPQPVAVAGNTASAAVDWSALVSDARLRDVVKLALANNRDLRVALLTVEQARATYRIQDAAQRPTLNLNAGQTATRTPAEASSSGKDTLTRTNSVGIGLAAYELDFFGRVSNLTESALQSYLGTEAAQRSTQLSLVGDVVTAWLTLAADQQQLALARDTLKSQQTTYALTEKRKALGAVSGLALVQTQTTVETARGNVASYESQVQRDRNALALLVGQAVPDALLPGSDAITPATAFTALVGVPEGVPSTVLQRRPDVLAAEAQLKAAQADMGAARAALFPRISLTASAGTASRSLDELFQGGAWNFAPTLVLPILDGGAAQTALRKAEITRDIRVASYDKAIQTAFREVADALAVRASLAERLSAQQALVGAYQQSLTLADARYKAGADTYLAVLDAQRSLYAAQQALIALQLTEQSNRVMLYKVLGGG